MIKTDRGKVFEKWASPEYWDYGVGAMSWHMNSESGVAVHELLVILPCLPEEAAEKKRPFPHKVGHHMGLLMVNNGKDWRVQGSKVMWDENEDAPTLVHSIQVDSWHGYIKNGKLVYASDSVVRPEPSWVVK